MKKVLMLLVLVVMVVISTFAQEVATPEKVGLLAKFGLDGWSIATVILGIVSVVAGSMLLMLRVKARELAELILLALDSYENDKKFDAKEKEAIKAAVAKFIKISKK